MNITPPIGDRSRQRSDGGECQLSEPRTAAAQCEKRSKERSYDSREYAYRPSNALGNRPAHQALVVIDLISTFVIGMIRYFLMLAVFCVASSHVSAEQGRASGHGDGFHGRKTASGERFNAFAMTAAHRTRPMGSYVRVTNLANGRFVRVRINDRGPARRTGKIIDLSYGASRVIGMGGTARVSVQAGGGGNG
jgi:rare lipoprotein A (peptidoglycan hydrolase)